MSSRRLLENRVGGVAGHDGVVNRKAQPGNKPNFVISPSASLEVTVMSAENLFELRRVGGHQDTEATTPVCSGS